MIWSVKSWSLVPKFEGTRSALWYPWRRLLPERPKEDQVANELRHQGTMPMRLKLIIAASSAASVVGAGLCIASVLAVPSSAKPFSSPGLLVLATFVIPVVAIVFASVFVYRHTARRRKLQAFLTAILATLLTISFFLIASILSSRQQPVVPPQPVGPHVAS